MQIVYIVLFPLYTQLKTVSNKVSSCHMHTQKCLRTQSYFLVFAKREHFKKMKLKIRGEPRRKM